MEAHDDKMDGVQGFGGWMFLFIVSLGISILVTAGAFLLVSAIFIIPGGWANFTSPGSPNYHPLYSTVFTIELVGNGLRLVYLLVLVYLLFKRRRIFRPLMLGYLVAATILTWVDHAIAQQIPAVSGHPNNGLANCVGMTLYALTWGTYLLVSHRARNTFVQ